MSKPAKLTPPREDYWIAKGKKGKQRLIPFKELSDDHLQKAYFVSQNKELEHLNKYSKFNELREGLEREATARGMELRSIADDEERNIGDYFKKERNDILSDEQD